MLVDSHCHLQDRKFEGDVDGVIHRARDAGVTAMVCVGYDMESSRRAVEIAELPRERLRHHRRPPARRKDAHAARPRRAGARWPTPRKVVAIGEIGLDFYRNLSPRETSSNRRSASSWSWRGRLSLPVVIHSRDADEETYEIVAEYEQQALPDWPKDRPLGVMHCFAGDLAAGAALHRARLRDLDRRLRAPTPTPSGRAPSPAASRCAGWPSRPTRRTFRRRACAASGTSLPTYVRQCSASPTSRGARFEEVADGTAMCTRRGSSDSATSASPLAEALGESR